MTHTMKIRVHPRRRMEVYVDGAHFKTFENESFDTPEIYEVEYTGILTARHSDILSLEEELQKRIEQSSKKLSKLA